MIVLLTAFQINTALAAIHPGERMTDPAQEQRAQALYHELRCAVCQNQSIAESGADIAADLRALVREQIEAGKSDEDILAYIRSRYGDFILMKPPLAPQTWLLWFGPLLVLLGGGTLCLRLIRKEDS